MAEAQIRETLSVPKAKLFRAITAYEDYPKFVDGCRNVAVERPAPGKAKVCYEISMMKEISYTLEHSEDEAAGQITWRLVESDFLSRNQGSWRLKEAGSDRTEIEYSIDIDFRFPVPGFVLGKLVKGSLPAMLRSFEKRARSL